MLSFLTGKPKDPEQIKKQEQDNTRDRLVDPLTSFLRTRSDVHSQLTSGKYPQINLEHTRNTRNLNVIKRQIKLQLEVLIGKAVYAYLNSREFDNSYINDYLLPQFSEDYRSNVSNYVTREKLNNYFKPEYHDMKPSKLKTYLYTGDDYAQEFVHPIESELIDFINNAKAKDANGKDINPYQILKNRIEFIDHLYKDAKVKANPDDATSGGKRKSMRTRKNGKTNKSRKNRRRSNRRRHAS